MAQAVIRRSPTAEARFRSQVSHVGFVVDKVQLEQGFLPVVLFSPISIISPILHTQVHLNTTLIKRTKGRSLGTLKQSNPLLDVWGTLGDESTFTDICDTSY